VSRRVWARRVWPGACFVAPECRRIHCEGVMTESSFATTNVLLGIMAAVSVIEIIVLVAAGIFGYRAYSRVMQTVDSLEARHVAPLTARTLAILDDVKSVTARAESTAGSLEKQISEGARRAGEMARRGRSGATRVWQQVENVRIAARETVASLLGRSNAPRHHAPTATSETLDDGRVRTGR
jgi:hypothetical protein